MLRMYHLRESVHCHRLPSLPSPGCHTSGQASFVLCKDETWAWSFCEVSKLFVPLSSCSQSELKQVIHRQRRSGTWYSSCKGNGFHWGPSSLRLINQQCTGRFSPLNRKRSGYFTPLKELLVVLNKTKTHLLAKLPSQGWRNPFGYN